LKMLVAQMKLYCPENPIYVIDNGSTYEPLLDYYYWKNNDFFLYKYPENEFVKNITEFISALDSDYFVLSDSDILLHPTVPFNFLEIFKAIIDSGVHHVGFDLIYEDIPKWNPKAEWIKGDERNLHIAPFNFDYNGETYSGFRAAVDTTFAMYKKSNGGWS